jgi:hypothetical protein
MREKQSYKTKYRGKILYISSKNKKIEDIFQGCLRFLDSKETNGSAPYFDEMSTAVSETTPASSVELNIKGGTE